MKVIPCLGLLEAESCQHAADSQALWQWGIFMFAGAAPEAIHLIPAFPVRESDNGASRFRSGSTSVQKFPRMTKNQSPQIINLNAIINLSSTPSFASFCVCDRLQPVHFEPTARLISRWPRTCQQREVSRSRPHVNTGVGREDRRCVFFHLPFCFPIPSGFTLIIRSLRKWGKASETWNSLEAETHQFTLILPEPLWFCTFNLNLMWSTFWRDRLKEL